MDRPPIVRKNELVMINIEPTDFFNIKGSGKMFMINRKKYPQVKIGSVVIYKNQKYRVSSIEYSEKLMWPPFISDDIGLIVREISDEY